MGNRIPQEKIDAEIAQHSAECERLEKELANLRMGVRPEGPVIVSDMSRAMTGPFTEQIEVAELHLVHAQECLRMWSAQNA